MLALALDLASLSKRLGQPLHGVLGHSFLKSLAVRIDYSARRIWFTDTAQVPATIPSRSPHQHLRAPLKLWDNFPILDGCLVNGQPLRLTLDTGSSAGLTLFPEAVQFLGLSETAHTGKSGTSLGYRGEEQSTLGQVRLLELGTIRLTDVETRFVVSGDRAKTPLKRRDGNIGNALLQDFALTLDYLNQTIILEQPQR